MMKWEVERWRKPRNVNQERVRIISPTNANAVTADPSVAVDKRMSKPRHKHYGEKESITIFFLFQG